MRHRLCSFSMVGILRCAAFSAAFSAGFSSGASAQNLTYECALSGNPSRDLAGCPGNSTGGYLTSTRAVQGNNKLTLLGNPAAPACVATAPPYCGAKSDAPSAVAPIEAWDICRWVDNTSPSAIFVPFRTSLEWTAFIKAAPTLLGGNNNVNPVGCALPAGDHGAIVQNHHTHPHGWHGLSRLQQRF